MPPSLRPVFTLQVTLSPPSTINLGPWRGSGPLRLCSAIAGGHLKSLDPSLPLHATVLPGGSDWLFSDASTTPPTAHLNVRVTARTTPSNTAGSGSTTDEPEAIAIQWSGIMRVDELAGQALIGAEGARTTTVDEHDWFVTLVFEVSSQRLKWMEQSVFVGQGRFVVDKGGVSVEYEVFKLEGTASR